MSPGKAASERGKGMSIDGRNGKIKPLGFDTAATVWMTGFSPEAARNLTEMVKDVARVHGHDDGRALKTLRNRLTRTAGLKSPKKRAWAQEALGHLPERRTLYGTSV